MTEPLEITIRTLTPLWTGGVDGTSDRLHATGIIGSLRWWYETIIRGMGGKVCDPIEQPCLYNADQPHNGLCLGCQTFGATGWARRFRLMIEDRTISGGPDNVKQPTGNRFKSNGQQRPSWYFKGGRTGELELRIAPTAAGCDPILVQGVLALIERCGGLAAKPQLGYGWIELVSGPLLEIGQFVSKVQSIAGSQPGTASGLPSLDKMFFAQVSSPDIGIAATLNMKYDLRGAFRSTFIGNRTLRHWVCGSVRGNERRASKISFTQAVDGVVRVWGWIPDRIPGQGITRDQVVGQINATLTAYGTVSSWREFDSARDTVSRQSDIAAFLRSLLEERS